MIIAYLDAINTMTALVIPRSFSPRKQNIARHFARANDYDRHANIQQQVCQSLLPSIVHTKQGSVLEIGAGTGQMTRLIAAHLQSERWLINELCSEKKSTLQSILPTAEIIIGDAESMDLSEEHSLIVSANAVQWFDSPLSFIAQSANRLQTGGQLLFNTFTPNNFHQIKRLTGQGLHYPAVNEWQLALESAYFKDIVLSTQRFDLSFSDPYAILRHMKLTGVSTNQTQVPSSGNQLFLWTKSRLKQFEEDYWTYFSEKNEAGEPNVILTYEVLIVSAIKK